MLSKICASWLVVLVLLPFTAPFSTFDLTDLLPARSNRGLGTPSSKPPIAVLSHVTLSRAVPLPPRTVGRTRLALTRLRSPHAAAIAFLDPAAISSTAPIHTVHPSSHPTVLRI